MGDINRIFVYGTLMKGLLKNVFPGVDLHIKKIEAARINARLFNLGDYPGAKQTSILLKEVIGEIYEIDPEYFKGILTILDEYEGYERKNKNSLYIRKITTVTMDDGSFSKAWVYWYNKPVSRKNEIEPGDYKKYLNRNK